MQGVFESYRVVIKWGKCGLFRPKVSSETVGKGREHLSDGVVLLIGDSRFFRNDTMYDGCFGFPTVSAEVLNARQFAAEEYVVPISAIPTADPPSA